jgi:hypothetical protein
VTDRAHKPKKLKACTKCGDHGLVQTPTSYRYCDCEAGRNANERGTHDLVVGDEFEEEGRLTCSTLPPRKSSPVSLVELEALSRRRCSLLKTRNVA